MKAQEKLGAGQQFVEMNNNNSNYVNNTHAGRDVLMCHKSTQWEESPRQSVSTKTIAPTKRADIDKKAAIGGIGRDDEGRRVLRRGNAEEGLTALKIKQLMTTTNSSAPRSSDKRISAQRSSLKTLHGHVSDLKMRFEDGGGGDVKELKQFRRAVDNVSLISRFAMGRKSGAEVEVNATDDLDEDQESVTLENIDTSDESADYDSIVVLRRKKRVSQSGSVEGGLHKYKLLSEFGGSVHSLEDILNQQRFSRSLSQYSVSDLCWNESPAQINRDCERFDELFCRSTGDLRNSSSPAAKNGNAANSSPRSTFGSMVDVVNV